MHKRAVGTNHEIQRAQNGSVAVLVAIMLTALLGFSALGTEVVFVMFKRRQMQAVASSAALAGATALMTGRPADYRIEVRAVATTSGFTQGVALAEVTVNNGPLSGSHVGDVNYVEVIIAQPQTLPLSSMFYAGPWKITTRAVAARGNSGGYCVLSLDNTTGGNLRIDNGADLTLNQCGLAVNATGPQALLVYWGSILTTRAVSVGGDVYPGGGTITATNGIKTQQPSLADPYSSVAVPTGTGCKYGSAGNPLHVLGWQNPTLSADGVYCGGLTMDGGGTVTLNPGVYIINGGKFSLQGGTRLVGNGGVTIVLTGSGTDYASASIANGATVALSAPTSGPTSGLLFFQNPAAPHTGTNSFAGGVNMTLTGALYFPSQKVTYDNGASATATCTQLIAWRMQFAGGAYFNSNCSTAGVTTIGSAPSELVE